MSEYIKYVLKNTEPLRIADDSSSQNGQTVTLRYIPGTTIRGFVVTGMTKRKDFSELKSKLFSNKVRYLNAYLTIADSSDISCTSEQKNILKELLPSPKGFYENKEIDDVKEIENVFVSETLSEGVKRAYLGRYCDIDGETINYYNITTGSDIKIKINDQQNMFRNEYICNGNIFTGYIAVDDESLIEPLKNILSGEVILGNARSAGMGKCKIISVEKIEGLPYEHYLPDVALKNQCYMYLLSNSVMCNDYGELCGLHLPSLEKLMQVEDLDIKMCSTSTFTVRGYNRTWGTKIPSCVMYEQGSVFKLTYSGTLTVDNIRKLVDLGIGVRRNEGFGRVLILKDYDKIKKKKKCEYDNLDIFDITDNLQSVPVSQDTLNSEDIATLKIVARGYYLKKLEKYKQKILLNGVDTGGIENSRLGNIEALALKNRYNADNGVSIILKYLDNALEKEEKSNIQRDKNSIRGFRGLISEILQDDSSIEDILNKLYNKLGQNENIQKTEKIQKPENIMGIKYDELFDKTEINEWKLQFIIDVIKFNNKSR